MHPIVLSIIIPAYNEAGTIVRVLERVTRVQLPGTVSKEIIVVNDCSSDTTELIVEEFATAHPEFNIRLLHNHRNSGKGFSIREGIRAATGDFVIVQDADLEYDPRDYARLLEPALEGFADVVYGSRLMSSSPRRILFFWHSIGNHFLTFLCNVVSNLNLTDMETGYKLFSRRVLSLIDLKENRFGFEPEVTIKLARIANIRFYEVGISYYGRTYAEGKKIKWVDGVRAIWCILKYSILTK